MNDRPSLVPVDWEYIARNAYGELVALEKRIQELEDRLDMLDVHERPTMKMPAATEQSP